jgi:hemerythrin
MPSWSPTYKVGHPVIDQQHEQLFAHADQLLEAMQQGRAREELEDIFQFLKEYVVQHFGTEERFMDGACFPGTPGHKAQHQEFVRRFTASEETYRTKGASSLVVLEIRALIHGWLVKHVTTVDMELAKFLRKPAAA